MPTSRAELDAFLSRPWDRLRREKDAWVARSADGSAGALLDIASGLRAHGATLGLDVAETELADLVRLKERLDLASRRLARAR